MKKHKQLEEHKQLKGIFIYKHYLLTKNLVPTKKVYGEKLFTMNNIEYREWNPYKSKLAAAIKNGISQIAIKPGSLVLYLGASSGTTVSHVSDIVGKDGFVYALDFSKTMVRDLYDVVKERDNMYILLEDANHPENYQDKISKVDVIYQDIAQKNQLQIFLKNIKLFLKKNGFAVMAVKARSIDVTKKPTIIFKQIKELLKSSGLIIVDSRKLQPYEKDHMIFVCKYS